MAVAVIMPRQGNTVESCIITKWSKQKGDAVKVGDILFSYETDKAAFDEEAKVEGTLLDVFFQEGDDVPCLTNVCVIGAPGESTAEFNPNSAAPAAEEKKEEAPRAGRRARSRGSGRGAGRARGHFRRSEDLAARQGASRAHRCGSFLCPSYRP